MKNKRNYQSKYQFSLMSLALVFLFQYLVFQPIVNAQDFQEFELDLEPITIPSVPGLHSFAWGNDSEGRWLLLGGRVDGLHQRQPFAAFQSNDNNKMAYVVDLESETVWSASLSTLPASLFEQLQSTNQEFFQRGNELYIIGGYGYSDTANDHITYPYLTAVNVDGLTNAIINGASITPYFRQLYDDQLAVTGGYVGYLDSVFYLAGGQFFEGRYNPHGPDHGPGFIQEYTDAIRKFKIEDNGTDLFITDFSEMVDVQNLHRRDYNMAPQFFPNGEIGFTMFSGVFQHDVDLPFLNSVDITPSGYTVNNSFNQYLSQYHSAHLPIYDTENGVMHTIFFGGMSQYTLNADGNLVEDENVPFVNTISRVTRFPNGSMQETKLGIEMPTLVGAGAEFIPHPEAPYVISEVLDLDEVSDERVLIGYIYGGIESTQENIFFINDGNQSFASNVIFKVYLKKVDSTVSLLTVEGENVFQMLLYPNPTDGQVVLQFYNPVAETIEVTLSDLNGEVLKTIFKGRVQAGEQELLFTLPDLSVGMYFISIENGIQKNVKTIFLE